MLLAADEAALHEAAEILLKKRNWYPACPPALPVSALDSTPEAVRSRAVQIAIAAVAGREKDIGYLHVHSVLELERGQVSLSLRRYRGAGGGNAAAAAAGGSPWRHSAFCRGRLFSSAPGG